MSVRHISPKCTICETEIIGDYCHTCGQKHSSDPTIWSLIRDYVLNIISTDSSVPRTLFTIIKDPFKVVFNYWHGFTGYYPSPGSLLVVSLSAAALHLAFVGDKLLGLTLSTNLQNQVLFWIIFMPILILTSWLSFMRIAPKLVRHVISTGYIATTFFAVITVLFGLIKLLFGDLIGVGEFMLFILMYFYWNSRVYKVKKSIWIKLLFVLIQALVFVAIMALFVTLVFAFNPGEIK